MRMLIVGLCFGFCIRAGLGEIRTWTIRADLISCYRSVSSTFIDQCFEQRREKLSRVIIDTVAPAPSLFRLFVKDGE